MKTSYLPYVVADAGYRSEAVFQALLEHPAELIVALGREGNRKSRLIRASVPCQRPWPKNSSRSSHKKRIEGASGYPSRPMAG